MNARAVSADLRGCGRGFRTLAQTATLFFGQAAPHARFLIGTKRKFEAFVRYRTLSANTLRCVDLVERATRGPDGEEEFRCGVTTSRAVTPFLRVPIVGPDPGQRHVLFPLFEGRT